MKFRTLLALPLALGLAIAAGSALQEGMHGAKPGEQHAVLAKMTGNWNTLTEMMGTESPGKQSFEMGLGGLWLLGDLEGELMGAPFTGHTVSGYDPDKEKYVAIWVDSFTSAMMVLEGEYDAEHDRLDYRGASKHPMTGEPTVEIHRWEFKDDDHMVFSIHYPDADGAAGPQLFAVDYTRAE